MESDRIMIDPRLLSAATAHKDGMLEELLKTTQPLIEQRFAGHWQRHALTLTTIDDLTSEAMLNAWRGFSKAVFPAPAAYVAWIWMIVDNLFRDAERREGRSRFVDEQDLFSRAHPDASSDIGMQRFADSETSVGTRIVLSEEKRAISAAVNELSSATGEAVKQFYFEQHPINDVACNLKRNPNSVKNLLRRGREIIRKILRSS